MTLLLFTDRAHATGTVPIKIMVVGDSISNGFNGDWTWRYRLWQQLSTAVPVDFVGPFQTVYNLNTQLQDLSYADPNFDREHDAIVGRMIAQEKDTIAGYVTQFQPDVLIVNLGTNDLTFGNQTGVQAAALMQTLITNARSAKSNIQIVLSKLTPITNPTFAPRWTDYNIALQALAAQMTTVTSPIVIADPGIGYDPVLDNRDGVHPSASGEWKYASAYYNGLGLLGIRPPPRTRPAPTGNPPMPDNPSRTRPVDTVPRFP